MTPTTRRLPDDLRPKQFRCFEYRQQMEGGWTTPRLVAATDETGRAVDIVLKFRDPGTPIGRGHFQGTSLAAELICATIAKALGMAVPTYGIAHVGRVFTDGVRDPDTHAVLAANLGENFATVHIPRQLGWDPNSTAMSLTLRQAMDDVLTFDATVFNGDRTRTKPNLLWDGRETIRVIDHGLACPVYNWPAETRAGSPLLPSGIVRDHAGYAFLYGKRCSFDEVHERWSVALSDDFWVGLAAEIPSSWEMQAGHIACMIDFLRARSNKFV